MHGLMLRNQSKHIWKILNGTCYLTRRIHQTYLFLITTYFDPCTTDFQNSTAILTKRSKIGSTNG